jgi:hypothetical protein
MLFSINCRYIGYFPLVMSRTFTLSGYSSILSENYYPPIELDVNSSYGVGLLGFYSYNSIFNVDESNNKIVLYFQEDDQSAYSITIPPGVYEIDEMNKTFQEQLKEFLAPFPNIEYDEEMFQLSANNHTMKCEILSTFNIDFSSSKCINTILGFESKLLKANTKHESSLPVNIMKVRLVRVDCNLVSGAYVNGKEMHTLFEFDIDVEPGYKLTKEPQNVIYLSVQPEGRQYLHNITLKILDDQDNLINFRGEQIIVKVELRKLS